MGGNREGAVGQWALIADNAKEAKSSARIMTNNARSESLASRPTFRGPWSRGQRCLIPADSFLEPNWESGKNEWWRFRRADGNPWGLAGLWNAWTDPNTGDLIESFTMLTMNARCLFSIKGRSRGQRQVSGRTVLQPCRKPHPVPEVAVRRLRYIAQSAMSLIRFSNRSPRR